MDEKAQTQALDRPQPKLQDRPGQVDRRTHDYERHGSASPYPAFDLATGKVLSRVTDGHRAQEIIAFLEQLERTAPRRQQVHRILDNSSTARTAEVKAFPAAHPRMRLPFTPTSASCLNAVKGWFSQLERRAVHRGVHTSVQDLRVESRRFLAAHNTHSTKPLIWTKSALSILDSVRRAATSPWDANQPNGTPAHQK